MSRIKHYPNAILAGAAATVVALGVGFIARDAGQHAAAAPPPTTPTPTVALPAQSTQIADVAERVVDSVVNISTSQTVQAGPASFDPFFTDPFSPWGGGEPDQRKAQSLGSGVIVSRDGKVLTNAHVVKDADEITVTLHDGSEVDAKVLGIDPRSDLAVLKLQGSLPALEPLPFADSGQLRLGEMVLAVGNPFGVGQAVTMGIVSATGRASVGIVDYEDFIQTDAAINPGNSGGALVNMRGELVGINTAILSRTGGYQGIGFAIPTNMARPIMDMLIKNGKVSRGYLGVSLAPLNAVNAGQLKIAPPKGVHGVLIAAVGDGTPAAKAGLAAGDLVTSIDGQEVRDVGRLRNTVAMKGAGKPVSLDVMRAGKSRTVTLTLGELPDADAVAAQSRGRGPRQAPNVMRRGERIIIHPDGRVERQPVP